MAAALAACSILAAPAAARTEPTQIGQRADVKINPGQGLIFFRTSERLDVQFIREPTAEERRAHEEARAAAYATARSRYERQFARWQREEQECRGNDASYCRYRPARPAEVSPETFAYPPLEMANMVAATRNPQFTRDESGYTYLFAVQPGTYILYGAITAGGNGPVGVCLCMGSVRFEVPEGRVVDLGEIRYPGAGTGEGRPARRNMASQTVVPATDASAVPERLAGLPIVRAELRAAGKLPNFFAVEIDRHPPIDGVLAYNRDRVIDLRAEPAAANGGN